MNPLVVTTAHVYSLVARILPRATIFLLRAVMMVDVFFQDVPHLMHVILMKTQAVMMAVALSGAVLIRPHVITMPLLHVITEHVFSSVVLLSPHVIMLQRRVATMVLAYSRDVQMKQLVTMIPWPDAMT
jgi:hypothetical protein